MLSVGSLTVTVTLPVGSLFRTTVYSAVMPSSTGSEVGDTVTPRASSSRIVTVALGVVVEALTLSGRAPNPSTTLSPSSSMASWVAVKVMSLVVSPVSKVTVAGTE